jgi:FK506-binding nuclear protein
MLLKTLQNCQQTLDFVVGEDERVFFKVSGTHTVHLTGNYVIPTDDGQAQLYDDEEEDDYDLSPDEEELDEDALDALEDEESDELDDLEDPRITEVASEDEAPTLLKASDKGKNKRAAEESDEEEDEANLDDMIATSLKKEEAAPAINGDTKKLSKAEKKALKKLKKNDGEAAPVTETPETKSKAAATNGSEKKSVQFAKNLEQGPTPSATPPAKTVDKKSDTAKASDKSAAVGVKNVQGVEIDDRKLGTGPAAKKGSRVEMRYIGKLESGKVFDSNKKGKPFSFKLGMGEVIKGWDIGVAGISVGGERRLTIPAHHGYGKKGAPPDIPPNSKLIFDIKCLSVS